MRDMTNQCVKGPGGHRVMMFVSCSVVLRHPFECYVSGHVSVLFILEHMSNISRAMFVTDTE